MMSAKMRKLWQEFTPLQLAGMGLAVLIVGLQLVIIALLVGTQVKAQPLLARSEALVALADEGPYIRESMVKGLLAIAADELRGLADTRIRYVFPISQNLHIATSVAVNERIPVPVHLLISENIPVDADIPLQERVLVPVRFEIDQVFPISASIPFEDEIVVPVNDVIQIDEKFTLRVIGQDIQVPVRGDIPIDLKVTVPIDTEFPVRANVPVKLPISQTIPVVVDWTVPIDLEIPVELPIDFNVIVPFSRTIPLDLVLPVVFEVPIDVAVNDTPLGEYLRQLADQLLRIAQDRP